jgi:hypothetical protein
MKTFQWQPTISEDLTGQVNKTSPFASAGGSYADIWQGKFEDNAVAIKIPRIVNVSAKKLSQVSISGFV